MPSGSPGFVGPAEFFSDAQVTCNLAGRSMVPYRVRVRNKDADSLDSQLFLPYHSACHKCSISGDVGTCTQVVSFEFIFIWNVTYLLNPSPSLSSLDQDGHMAAISAYSLPALSVFYHA